MEVKREQQQAHDPPMRPQFFRILLPGFTQRLRIPQQFSKYILAEIQQKAIMMCPLGNPLPLEVHRGTNFFYFGEGWREFSQAHDLDVGSFLVFRYEGGMVSTVTIFDQTTCMKEYSPARLLPREFLKFLSEENSTSATIFSPADKAWHIKVQEGSKGFHFADGWQRFAEAHNLRTGDTLVFRHNGGLAFDIAIFDNS